jgi:hypothetical protein
MNPRQSLEIQLVGNNGTQLQIGNVLLELNFFVGGQYRFGFKIGRTNSVGALTISYDDVEQIRTGRAVENLMDYNSKPDDCDNRIQIVIPSERTLREQVAVVQRIYQTAPEWSKHWPSNANIRPAEALVDLIEGITHIEIHTEPT